MRGRLRGPEPILSKLYGLDAAGIPKHHWGDDGPLDPSISHLEQNACDEGAMTSFIFTQSYCIYFIDGHTTCLGCI